MSVDRTPPGQPSPEDKSAAAKRRTRGGLGCVVVVVLAFAGCATLASIGANSDHTDSDALAYQNAATSLCEDLVKAQLKAPSTATFEHENASGSSDIRVTGTVNSQNSFGAMLASTFSCSATVDSSETVHATLESLD